MVCKPVPFIILYAIARQFSNNLEWLLVSNPLDRSMKIAPVALLPSASFHIRSVKKVTANSVEWLGWKPYWCSERKPLDSRCFINCLCTIRSKTLWQFNLSSFIIYWINVQNSELNSIWLCLRGHYGRWCKVYWVLKSSLSKWGYIYNLCG